MHRSKLAVAITTALSLSPAMPVLAGTISFAEVPVPFTDFAKRQVVASGQASVDGRDVNIGYHTILRSGDQVGRGPYA